MNEIDDYAAAVDESWRAGFSALLACVRENVPDGCAFVRGSVLDEGALAEAMRDVDAVLHEAARVTVRGSMDAYVEDAETNLLGAHAPADERTDRKSVV